MLTADRNSLSLSPNDDGTTTVVLNQWIGVLDVEMQLRMPTAAIEGLTVVGLQAKICAEAAEALMGRSRHFSQLAQEPAD